MRDGTIHTKLFDLFSSFKNYEQNINLNNYLQEEENAAIISDNVQKYLFGKYRKNIYTNVSKLVKVLKKVAKENFLRKKENKKI